MPMRAPPDGRSRKRMPYLRRDMTAEVINQPLAELDPDIAEVLAGELDRQRGTLEMIASENFVPRAVLECQGSVLTNKESFSLS